jgi:hypothetical protein
MMVNSSDMKQAKIACRKLTNLWDYDPSQVIDQPEFWLGDSYENIDEVAHPLLPSQYKIINFGWTDMVIGQVQSPGDRLMEVLHVKRDPRNPWSAETELDSAIGRSFVFELEDPEGSIVLQCNTMGTKPNPSGDLLLVLSFALDGVSGWLTVNVTENRTRHLLRKTIEVVYRNRSVLADFQRNPEEFRKNLVSGSGYTPEGYDGGITIYSDGVDPRLIAHFEVV